MQPYAQQQCLLMVGFPEGSDQKQTRSVVRKDNHVVGRANLAARLG